MKAMVYSAYGAPDVLELQEFARPTPKDNEVLIRVVATTVTSAECGMRRGEPRWGRVIIGLTRPRRRMRILGTEVAGEIESVGKDVRRFRKGDQVYGFTGETYDIIYDTVGKSSFSQCRGSLRKSGCYLPTTGLINNLFMLWTSMTGGKKVLTGMSVEKNAALAAQ